MPRSRCQAFATPPSESAPWPSRARLRHPEVALDPMSFALGAVGLLLVAALAAVLPARHAVSVDPMVALRSE